MSHLIELLNGAFEAENKAFRGYIYAAVTVTGPLHDVYEEIYKQFSNREAEHIYEIGEKITALGGKPSTKCLPITEVEDAVPLGYDATLAALQGYEDATLAMYKEIHKAAMDEDDLTTALLIEHILEEEQEHFDELERILMDVPGDNNVETHDVLEVKAFYDRRLKIAAIFNDDAELVKALNDNLVNRMIGNVKIDKIYTRDELFNKLKQESVYAENEINDLLGRDEFLITGRIKDQNGTELIPLTREEAIVLLRPYLTKNTRNTPHLPPTTTDNAGPAKASHIKRRQQKLAALFSGK